MREHRVIVVNDGLGNRYVAENGYSFLRADARISDSNEAQIHCEQLRRMHPDVRAWTEALGEQSE